MPELVLDKVSGQLLGLLQTGFPLEAEPYTALGSRLGISEGEVIRRIGELRASGIVRLISPVLDARRLGYSSTLAALEIPPEHIASAEQYLASHPGISHGYEREHRFNIWVTLSVPPADDLKGEVADISHRTGAGDILSLPAVKVFKLRTNFSQMEDDEDGSQLPSVSTSGSRAFLSAEERQVINSLQQDLPLEPGPFARIASGLGMDEDSLLGHCRSLLKSGVIRRYGASVNHYMAGYKANAMTCWLVEPGHVDKTARHLASLRRVSHCYERETAPQWHYNLFAMLHGSTKDAVLKEVDHIAKETGLRDYEVLFSTREFKKTRIIYKA
jgi:DNA-binding Lrp family transcriptional regulator